MQITDRRRFGRCCDFVSRRSSEGWQVLLEKLSRAETSTLWMRPMRSTSVTMPVETKVAHTVTASAASSGDESAAKAGVSAELICA